MAHQLAIEFLLRESGPEGRLNRDGIHPGQHFFEYFRDDGVEGDPRHMPRERQPARKRGGW